MGWFTDLIKEYPALAVVKERLALAQEKYDAVIRENEKLKDELKTLQKENDRLKTHISKAPASDDQSVSDTEIEILKVFGNTDKENLTASMIAAQLNLNRTRAEYYLSKLNEEEYLGILVLMDSEMEYYLRQRGREYLVQKDLV